MPTWVAVLALVYAWTGEHNAALEQLEIVATIPGGPTYADLRLNQLLLDDCAGIRASTKSSPQPKPRADSLLAQKSKRPTHNVEHPTLADPNAPTLTHPAEIRCQKILANVECASWKREPIVVRQMLCFVREDLQPKRFEQSHAQNVLAFVTDDDVVKENTFQLETEPAVEIDISDVDVARVYIHLVQVSDHERVIKETERPAFADAFALQPGLPHQLFHLEFTCRQVDVLTADDSYQLVIVVDAKIFPGRIGKIFSQLALLFRKCRHEAFAHSWDF